LTFDAATLLAMGREDVRDGARTRGRGARRRGGGDAKEVARASVGDVGVGEGGERAATRARARRRSASL